MKNEERDIELENILNSMLDPVHITNRDFEVEFVNRACRKVFGVHTPGIKCYKYFHNFEGLANGADTRKLWWGRVTALKITLKEQKNISMPTILL